MERTSGGVTNRRLGALYRLQEQLKSNKKPAKTEVDGKVVNGYIELTDHDVKRINREIDKLTERVK